MKNVRLTDAGTHLTASIDGRNVGTVCSAEGVLIASSSLIDRTEVVVGFAGITAFFNSVEA